LDVGCECSNQMKAKVSSFCFGFSLNSSMNVENDGL